MITKDAGSTGKLKPGLSRQSSFLQEAAPFRQQIGVRFWEETSKVSYFEYSLVWCLDYGHFGKIRNNWEVLQFGAGEGWRSVAPIV